MALTKRQLSSAAARRKKLVALCQELPEVLVQQAGEDHLSFRVRKKTFGYYLFDHHGDGRIAFTCKSTLPDQRQLVRDDPVRFYVPAYLGPKGWIALRLDTDDVDWGLVLKLALAAYRHAAPKSLADLV
jgi:hypothetical protein